ncbi:hypothetical protein BU204_36600 [Actinophytocola xanthii]|uniref:Uncharacterized protein n=1 Tax=Actinophytocola xanthii TaxID=1912961 RepID=A0A1Q8BVI6_9PSEU|nr:hypothetical protein BU204_36600 [Actinophytocola xanthii]
MVGLLLAAIMLVYLATYDGVWESDNPFLVPDILMGALLLASSVLPSRWAPPAMIFAFGWTAGILAVTVFNNQLTRDEFSVLNLGMALAAAAMTTLLIRVLVAGRVPGQVGVPAG